jgi:hypothetical protein
VELILVYEKLEEMQKPAAVIMLPAPSNALEPMNTPKDVPERIVRAVRDAEAAFTAGLYSSALTNAGIALEGLLRNSLTEEKRNRGLYELIEEFCASETSIRPVKALAHSLRQGRNTGAHFDELIEPTKESAETMIDLLRLFFAYYYEFEDRAAHLNELIKGN